MATAQRKNAIERRIDLLADHWNDFARNPNARLLRWLVRPDEARLLDVFFEVQNEEEGGSDIPDLFIRLNAPFKDPGTYGFELANSLRAEYEASRADLESAGLNSSWVAPAPASGSGDIQAFLDCCISFRRHHQELMLTLAVVLQPETIVDPRQLQIWLYGLVRSAVPDDVRFTYVDHTEAPVLEDLAKWAGGLVVTVAPNLNMPGAVSELAAQSGGSGPGAEFRRHFLELANLGSRGEVVGFQQNAQAALAIAEREKWPALAVVIHSLAASTWLRLGNVEQSIASYRAAGQQAEAAGKAGEAGAPKLLLQARFGEAAAWLSQGKFAEAATVYRNSAGVAQQAGDPLMTVEAWRMAGYCHEQAGNADAAWQSWWQALGVAQSLEPSLRANSTLPYVGQGLLRLAASPRYAEHTTRIHDTMRRLAGPEWVQSLQPGGNAP